MTATHTTGTPLRSGSDLNPTTPEGGPADPRREPARLQQDLRDHLLLNFTDMSEFADSRRARVRPRRRAATSSTPTAAAPSTGISGLFCTNLGHSLRRRGRPGRPAPAGRAGVHAVLVRHAPERRPSWPSGSPSRRRPGAAARLLHQRRRRGQRVGLEARPAVARRQRPAAAPQGDRAPARLPRHLARARCRFTGLAVRQHAVRAAADPDRHVSNTNAYRHPLGARRGGVHRGAARRGRGDDRSGRAPTASPC